MKPLRVVLVDPSQLFCDGLRRLFEAYGCEVVAQSPSLQDAVHVLATSTAGDMLIFDFADDDNCGPVIEQLRFAWPSIKYVVLTGNTSRKALARAIGWAVDSYLSKDMSAEVLIQSCKFIMLGQQIFPTKLMMSMSDDGAEVAAEDGRRIGSAHGLSPREVEILRALSSGKSNKEIARALAISEATVKVHLKALLRKVRVNNRTQAAVWAVEKGIERVA
jgi:two-component system, NarL family, nitrate/nitrite response regulator NarL